LIGRFGSASDEEAPFRFSAFYRLEERDWKMVHFHSSVGVSNEEALGVELTDEPYSLSPLVRCTTAGRSVSDPP
jgi:hypothetical protein